MKRLAIIGAGGFAREVYWLLEDLGLAGRVDGFYESDAVWQPRRVSGLPVHPLSSFTPGTHEAVLGIGSPAVRARLVGELPADTTYPTLVHPGVQRSRRVEIGNGVVICAGCILTCDIVVGNHVQLNLATTVGHDCRLHEYVTTAPAVNISGGCDIGARSYIGTNASLREGLTIPPDTTIGMGAVLVSSPEEPGIYVGNPAKRRI